jgi:hypothetical protein
MTPVQIVDGANIENIYEAARVRDDINARRRRRRRN